MDFLNVGFDNSVALNRVIAIIAVNSTPVRRMIDYAANNGTLVDATRGKKVKALVVTDSNHCIISAIAPETLLTRAKEAGLILKTKEQDKK